MESPWRARLAAPLIVTITLSAACGDDDNRPNLVEATTTTTTTTIVPSARAIGVAPPTIKPRQLTAPSPTAFRTIVATSATAEVVVFDDRDGEEDLRLPNPTVSGGPLIMVVEEVGDEWHRVSLPSGPTESGWVRAEAVELAAHEYRIEIDTDSLELRLFERTVEILTAEVGLDPDNSPPPGSTVFVTELLAAADPDPVYGTYAYGLSGWAEEFTTFTGAEGQHGIHGTTEPETIGERGGPGSIRLGDADIAILVELLPLGVPVTVL